MAWAGDMRFAAKSETGADVILETGKKYGGSGDNPTPMEAVVMALASCSGMDIVMILKKMRVELKKLEIKVDAKRRNEDPSYFEDIKMTFIASGDGLAQEQLEKAVGLSVDKYCSVAAMLREKASITYEAVVE